MRPLLLLSTLALANPASAQDDLQLTAAYDTARYVGWSALGAPAAGALVSSSMTAAGVHGDNAVVPFGMALLVSGPALAWSANRGRRLLIDAGASPNGLWGDLAVLSSLTFATGLGLSLAEVIEGDGSIGVMCAGLVGTYVAGALQWRDNARTRRQPGAMAPLEDGRSMPPVTLRMRW